MPPRCFIPGMFRIVCMIIPKLKDLKPQMIVHLSSGQYMRLNISLIIDIQIQSDSRPFNNIWSSSHIRRP